MPETRQELYEKLRAGGGASDAAAYRRELTRHVEPEALEHLNATLEGVDMEEPVVKRSVGRPTRFPGKTLQSRLTVSLTPACREHIESISRRLSCSLSDVVEFSVWQQEPGPPPTTTSTGGQNE